MEDTLRRYAGAASAGVGLALLCVYATRSCSPVAGCDDGAEEDVAEVMGALLEDFGTMRVSYGQLPLKAQLELGLG